MTGGTKGSKPKFIIYKISDNKKEVVVEDVSEDPDYEVFLKKLEDAKDSSGKPAPRYAIYDVEYDLGEAEGQRYIFTSCPPLGCCLADNFATCRSKIMFISWVPSGTSTIVCICPTLLIAKRVAHTEQ